MCVCLPSFHLTYIIHEFLQGAAGMEYRSSFSVVPPCEGFSLFLITLYSTIGKRIRSSTPFPPIIAKWG